MRRGSSEQAGPASTGGGGGGGGGGRPESRGPLSGTVASNEMGPLSRRGRGGEPSAVTLS